jgi:hypothetical protein
VPAANRPTSKLSYVDAAGPCKAAGCGGKQRVSDCRSQMQKALHRLQVTTCGQNAMVTGLERVSRGAHFEKACLRVSAVCCVRV